MRPLRKRISRMAAGAFSGDRGTITNGLSCRADGRIFSQACLSRAGSGEGTSAGSGNMEKRRKASGLKPGTAGSKMNSVRGGKDPPRCAQEDNIIIFSGRGIDIPKYI